MTYVGRVLSDLFSRAGLVLLLGALTLGLTGCYTQLQVTERAGHQTRVDRDQGYADEYRREYHRDSRQTTVEYRHTYYGNWHHDPFLYDPFWYGSWHHDPWFGPYYGSRFSLSFHFGSPYFYGHSWYRSPWRYGYYDPFHYRPYRPYYAGVPYYYGQSVYSPSPSYGTDRRDYRPRGGTIGRTTSGVGSRDAGARRSEATVTADRASSSQGRIGKRSAERESRAPSRVTRSERPRSESGRVGRSSTGRSTVGRSSGSTKRSSPSQRAGRQSSNEGGSKARGSRSSGSESGRGRSSRGSSGSSEEGSRSGRGNDASDEATNRSSFRSVVLRSIPSRIDADQYERERRRLLERSTRSRGYVYLGSGRSGKSDLAKGSRHDFSSDWNSSRATSTSDSGSGDSSREVQVESSSDRARSRSTSTSRSSRTSRSNDNGSNREARGGNSR